MTIHGAKGLEFETVFVAGLDDEQIPHKNSRGSQDAICEERRLFYVALTRAKTHLYLSSANSKGLSRIRVHREKSRFISEMPSATIVYEGTQPAQAPSKSHTLKTLASLRGELGV
jgi:DNA helicase-2/ATP-dependent DNA helicase PcrA